MTSQIEQILRELYQIDPSLKQQEDRVVAAISRILEARPDTKFDEVFAQNLRHQLMHAEPAVPVKEKLVEIRHDFFRRLSFAGTLVAVFAALIATTLFINNKNGNDLSFFSPGVKITSAGERAFGQLASVSNEEQSPSSSSKAVSDLESTTKPEEQTAPPAPPTAEDLAKLYPIPQPVYYKYVYKGNPLQLTDNKRQVLKRLRGDAVAADFSSLLDTLGLGLINLKSFNNSKLQTVSFVEDGQNGYTINIDAQNASINIYGYWPIQPLPLADGDQAAGMPLPPLTPSEVPDDATVIGIANDFLATHQIPLTAYGAGEVQDWKIYYELSKKQGYGDFVPEVINVIYPLEINDQVVLDESGNNTGLIVGVDIRNKKVASVWDLSAQNYQASMYDAEKEFSKILQIAERGGVYGYYPPECSTPPFTPDGRSVPQFQTCKVVEVELGTPKIELVKMWNYKDNESQELLIPSVVFPLLNPPAELSYRKAVVIPLIKEILDNQMSPPMPVPLLKPEMAQ